MTQPAQVTSSYDWDRLIIELTLVTGYAEDVYERILDRRQELMERTAQAEDERTADPNTFPNRGFELDEDRVAEQEEEWRERLDYESDGRLDGDYDTEPPDDRDRDIDVEI